MIINNSAYTHNNLSELNYSRDNSLQRVATGLLINQAADNAAGLAIADSLRTEASSLSQSIANSTSGIALSDIAQGALREQSSILDRVKELTIEGSNGTLNSTDREAIALEIGSLMDSYDSIAEQTNYNGVSLLTTAGDASDEISISGENETTTMNKADTTSISDSIRTELANFTTSGTARDNLLGIIDNGLDQLSSFAGEFGSASNALESGVRNKMSQVTNTLAAESAIRDVDYAEESANFASQNVLSQAGAYSISQANAVQQNVLRLLQ